MYSGPLDPSGDVRGYSVGCTLSMSVISLFRAPAAFNVHREFPELNNVFSSGYVLGAAGFRVFFFFERTRPAASMRQSCLIYLSTINSRIEK